MIVPGKVLIVYLIAQVARGQSYLGTEEVLSQVVIWTDPVAKEEVSQLKIAIQSNGLSRSHQTVGFSDYVVDHPEGFTTIHDELVQAIFFIVAEGLGWFGNNGQVECLELGQGALWGCIYRIKRKGCQVIVLPQFPQKAE